MRGCLGGGCRICSWRGLGGAEVASFPLGGDGGVGGRRCSRSRWRFGARWGGRGRFSMRRMGRCGGVGGEGGAGADGVRSGEDGVPGDGTGGAGEVGSPGCVAVLENGDGTEALGAGHERDLVTGSRQGNFTFYRNTSATGFELEGKRLVAGEDGVALRHSSINPSVCAYPNAAGIAEDLIACGEGSLYFYRFTGGWTAAGAPVYGCGGDNARWQRAESADLQ